MSNEQQNQQQFNIEKVYLKDVSFESPNTPALFMDSDFKPELNVQINTEGKPVADNVHEIILTVTVTAKYKEQTAFLAEVKHAGLFQMIGFEQDQLNGMLGAYCPEVLFPFARETIADLITKGGFPQVLLAPVNFNALYMQHQQEQEQTKSSAH